MELARFPSHGGFSVRSIFTFVLAVVAAALLWATFGSTPTHAADASWSSGSIVHANHLYKKMEAKDIPAGIPADASVYTYTPTAANGSDNKEAFFIYFASGVDPPTATSANYVAYDYDISSKTYSNPHDSRTISIADDAAKDGSLSSCSVQGIGWIVCPVTVFLADGMDVMFDTLAKYFLQVQPLLSTNDNGLHTAWTIMQTIANIAFVIVFLIIIYSQLTNYGISNYGLKRLLPRLIIAAILVNLSFTIAAAAIDISNILGYSIQNIFEAIRKDTFHMTNETWGSGLNNGWSALAAGVLAGGGAVVGGMYAVSSGAYMLLIPLVVLLAVTLFLVLVVLAARQAIIIILVVIAPLAFVANLLPNTEKWFGKWRDTFMTMLIFFPAFSLAFGGSQLAGQVIIMNAGDNIIMVIFGMAVQIAPLVITPLLFKLSGGILGKIAQIANNPNKGLLDRNKKWAHDMAEAKRLNTVGKDLSNKRKANPLTWGARTVKANEFRRRNLAQRLKTEGENADAAYLKTDKAGKLGREHYKAEHNKHLAEDHHKLEIQREINERGSELHVQNLKIEDLKLANEVEQAATVRATSEYKSGRVVATGELAAAVNNLKDNSIKLAAEKQGAASADYEVTRNISNAMNAETVAGDALRTIAGSVGGAQAQIRARAQATATLNKLKNDALNANVELMKSNAEQAGTTVKKYTANIVEAVLKGETSYDGKPLNSEVIHAALQAQALEKNMSLFEKVRGSTNFDQQLVSSVIADNNTNFKIAGGFHLQDDPTLNINAFNGDVDAFNRKMALARIQSLGNTGAENLSGLKAGWVHDLADPATIQLGIAEARAAGDYESLVKAYNVVKRGLTNPDLVSKIEDREMDVRAIERALAEAFGERATDDPNAGLINRITQQ